MNRDFFVENRNFPRVEKWDIIIVGGGLAGLTSALSLSGLGHRVLLFETNRYPHHKVCGEYVSNEVRPYLQSLGIDLLKAGAVQICNFEISTENGNKVQTKLPLGGMGISRYRFDELLYEKAKAQGVRFSFTKVLDISYDDQLFTVTNEEMSYRAPIVLGAYGKRSALDKHLNRRFSFKKQDWLAVKAHYNYPHFKDNLVALHNFEGGYAGLSKTETGTVNFCYLAHYDSFKRFNDIDAFNQAIVSRNPFLKQFLEASQPVFDKPMAIAQISFDKKSPVENHVLMCGDTAGLIHPLCGNGMAMAIHSAKIVSEQVHRFISDPEYDRPQMESAYALEWNRMFKHRLWFGRRLQHLLLNKHWMNTGISVAKQSPPILNYVISKTHGKPVV